MEWQTWRSQTPLGETPCGFKSHPGHQRYLIVMVLWSASLNVHYNFQVPLFAHHFTEYLVPPVTV